MFPEADIPVVAMSLQQNLDPQLHCALGAALRSLRDEGLLAVVSGMLPSMIASGAGSDAPGRRLWRGAVGPGALGAWAFDQADGPPRPQDLGAPSSGCCGTAGCCGAAFFSAFSAFLRFFSSSRWRFSNP